MYHKLLQFKRNSNSYLFLKQFTDIGNPLCRHRIPFEHTRCSVTVGGDMSHGITCVNLNFREEKRENLRWLGGCQSSTRRGLGWRRLVFSH